MAFFLCPLVLHKHDFFFFFFFFFGGGGHVPQDPIATTLILVRKKVGLYIEFYVNMCVSFLFCFAFVPLFLGEGWDGAVLCMYNIYTCLKLEIT